MKIRVIRLEKIDDLLEEYEAMGNKGESFSEFIGVSKCLYDNDVGMFDWEEVDENNLKEVYDEEDTDELKRVIRNKVKESKDDNIKK